MVDRDGLENRFPLKIGTWVRIPPSPPVYKVSISRVRIKRVIVTEVRKI